MSPQIHEELLLLCMSIYGGLILVVCYDGMRIFRRVFQASVFRVIVEDVIFWTVASIYIFNIFLKYNYGRPRYFAVGATLGTMALYEWLIGRRIVHKVSEILRKLLMTFLKPLKKVKKVITLKLCNWKKDIRKKRTGKKGKACQKEETADIHREVNDRQHHASEPHSRRRHVMRRKGQHRAQKDSAPRNIAQNRQ